jgi:DNA-binding CsgD family transcriptional regulator
LADQPDSVLEVVSLNPLPALILELPSERIVDASPAAVEMFSPQDGELIGRNFESFTTDAPSDALEVLIAGRLEGYETTRHFRVSERSTIQAQVWVRAIGEEIPPRHVLVVIVEDGGPPGGVRAPLPEDFNALIGTTDVNLRIERVHSDAEALVGNVPEGLIGQTLFGIVHPDDLARLMWALAQATSTGKGVALHVHVNNATEQARLCQMLLLPMDPPPSSAFALFSFEDSNGSPDSDVEPSLGETRGSDLLDISRDLASLTEAQVPGILELSSRELEVVTRLLAGKRVPAIAEALFVSQSTVRNHLSSVFRKLNVQSQQELIDLLVFRRDNAPDDK